MPLYSTDGVWHLIGGVSMAVPLNRSNINQLYFFFGFFCKYLYWNMATKRNYHEYVIEPELNVKFVTNWFAYWIVIKVKWYDLQQTSVQLVKERASERERVGTITLHTNNLPKKRMEINCPKLLSKKIHSQLQNKQINNFPKAFSTLLSSTLCI